MAPSGSNENALYRWLGHLSPEDIVERLGERFRDYLLVENGHLDLRNTGWYVEEMIRLAGFHGNVLDMGCGFGIHSVLLRLLCPDVDRVTGVDVDKGKLVTFRRLLDGLRLDGVLPLTAPAEELPLPSATYDIVYCNESLSHVPDIRTALAEVHRVLRPGGTVIVSDTAKWNPYALWFVYGRGHLDEHYFSKHAMRSLLLGAGFTDVSRVRGVVAPRNPKRDQAEQLWWLFKYIDPKYVMRARK